MSNLRPNSVSDTTPLQRFESQSSGPSEPSSPVYNALSVPSGGGNPVLNGRPLPSMTASVAEACTLSLANHNNNKIDINLNGFMSSPPAPSSTNTNSSTSTTITTTSDTGNSKAMSVFGTRQIWERILWDSILLGCVGLPILLFSLYGVSHKRGFFCNDETLKHPYHSSSIRTWMLYLIGVIIPACIITAVEFFRANAERQNGFVNLNQSRCVLFGLDLPVWIVECYKKIGPLLFGVAAGQLAVDIGKYSIGRLRPHFFAVCQPIMPDGSTCDDPINAGLYIEDFHCRGDNFSAKILKESRLSFPSGHSQFALFTMLYIAVYLQERVTWSRAKMLKHLVQLVFLLLAWYTCLSRVSDYKHHWTDVLAGAVMGTLNAAAVIHAFW